MTDILTQVRVDILAGRSSREALIAQKRKSAMQALDHASQDEVILYLQLRCDVEGKHNFVAEPLERQYDDGTYFTRHQCQQCGWTHDVPSQPKEET